MRSLYVWLSAGVRKALLVWISIKVKLSSLACASSCLTKLPADTRSLAWECPTHPWSALGMLPEAWFNWNLVSKSYAWGRSFFLLPWSLIFPSFGPSIHSAGSKGYFCLCFRLITNLRGTCTCKPQLKGPLSPPHEVDISRLKFRIMVTSSFSTRNSTSAKFMAAQPAAQVLYAASDPSVS